MNNPLSSRGMKKIILSISAVVIALMIASILMWRLNSTNAPVDAGMMIDDSCARLENQNIFDISFQSKTYGISVNIRNDNYNSHTIYYDDSDNVLGEFIIIYESTGNVTMQGEQSADISTQSHYYTEFDYSREVDKEGQWEDWKVEVSEQIALESSHAGSNFASSGSVPILTKEDFCGYLTDRNADVQFIGTETVEGYQTDHFKITFIPGYREDLEFSSELPKLVVEYWVDFDRGRMIRSKVTRTHKMLLGEVESIDEWSFEGSYSGWGEPNVIVAPVTGTLHEAFLEMAADGGADSLEPAGFAVEGAGATEITELKWQDGSVSLTLSPSNSLTGYVLDFFTVDGTVSLSLDAASATAAGGKLSWAVAEAPWQDGDHLMLRIRETGSKPIEPTPTPTPPPVWPYEGITMWGS